MNEYEQILTKSKPTEEEGGGGEGEGDDREVVQEQPGGC